jgi:hypothetical protein
VRAEEAIELGKCECEPVYRSFPEMLEATWTGGHAVKPA